MSYNGADSGRGRVESRSKEKNNIEINMNKNVETVYNKTNLRKPKRPTEEVKKQAKQAKQKKEKASELAKDLEEKVEIADKAAKIKAALGSLKRLSFFTPYNPSQELEQPQSPEEERAVFVPRVKIDKRMVPDLVLTASDLAEVGRGKYLGDSSEEDTDGDTCRPSVLPAFHDDQVVPPPSNISSSESLPKPRVAYIPGVVTMQTRKRTFSESSCLLEPALKRAFIQNKRGRKTSELQCVDEAMGQLMEKQRVEKLKKSLLKMDKKSLKELVENPTSSKSRLLMSALLQDHRSLISNCLNRARFCRVEPVENGKKIDTLEDELDALPNSVMVEISDIIKQEVPDIEIILEVGGSVKQESGQQFGALDLNVKCEVEYGQEQWSEDQSDMFRRDMERWGKVKIEDPEQQEVLEVPVLPRTPPPLIDLENISVENRSSRNDIQIECAEASTSKSLPSGSTDPIDKATRLAPVYKKRGRPCKGQERKIGGHELVIGSIGDLVNVQGYQTSDTDNDGPEENEQDKLTQEDNSNTMRSLGLIFEQESRLLSDLESVDSKMSSLAQDRSSLVQQLQFLSELKRQMFKQ